MNAAVSIHQIQREFDLVSQNHSPERAACLLSMVLNTHKIGRKELAASMGVQQEHLGKLTRKRARLSRGQRKGLLRTVSNFLENNHS